MPWDICESGGRAPCIQPRPEIAVSGQLHVCPLDPSTFWIRGWVGPKDGLDSFTFISQPALTQIHSPFQSQFSTECDLVLPFSIYSIISSLRSSSSRLCLRRRLPVTSTLPFILLSKTCLRSQFFCDQIQLALFLHITCSIFLSSLSLCNTS
jgi:hypothetical protein